MEYENRYASKGVGSAGLATGIIGTALGALNSGIFPNVLGGMFGGWQGNNCGGYAVPVCSENMAVNRYEAEQSARIAELETEVKLRDANTYTDQKILDLYRYVDGKFDGVNAAICQQNVYNATNTAALGCLQGQVAQLFSLTKLVVPNTSVCPGWGDVTVTPAAAPATAAAGA